MKITSPHAPASLLHAAANAEMVAQRHSARPLGVGKGDRRDAVQQTGQTRGRRCAALKVGAIVWLASSRSIVVRISSAEL